MISVAMCTYNGSRFLREQLESIADQTLRVDELIVCDDCSTDDTIEILDNFAGSALFEIQVHRNTHNLGSTKNFEKCLQLCRGDIIFLCDQDDIWFRDKVERQVQYLHEHPELDAVFSDASIVDEDSRLRPGKIWEAIEFNKEEQARWLSGRAYEILFGNFIVTGATLALRKSALTRLVPFPVHLKKYIHDAWIALVLGVQDKIGFIPDPLLSYRLHHGQQVGFGEKQERIRFRDRLLRDRTRKLAPLREKAALLKELYATLERLPYIDNSRLEKLKIRQLHFETRAHLSSSRVLRIGPVLRELLAGNYKFSSKDWWLPALGDLLE